MSLIASVYGFDLEPPATAPTVVASSGGNGGNDILMLATYTYKYTYINAYGETLASPASIPVISTRPQLRDFIDATNVTDFGIYRSNGGPYQLVEIVPISTDIYYDITADADLGAEEPFEGFGSSIGLEAGYILKTKPPHSSFQFVTAIGTSRIDAVQAPSVGLIIIDGTGGVLLPPITTQLNGLTITLQNTTAAAITLYPNNPAHTVNGSASYDLDDTTTFTAIDLNWSITSSSGIGGNLSSATISGVLSVNNIAPNGPNITFNSDVSVTGNVTANNVGLAIENDSVEIVPNTNRINFTGDGVVVTDNITETVIDLNNALLTMDGSAIGTRYPSTTINGVWYGEGTKQYATASTNTLIGNGASGTGTGITCVGANAVSEPGFSDNTVVGVNSYGYSESIAVGVGARSEGTGGVGRGIAIGVSSLCGTNGVSIGFNARSTAVDPVNTADAIAIGFYTRTIEGGIALGAQSVARLGGLVVGRSSQTIGDVSDTIGDGIAIGTSTIAGPRGISVGTGANCTQIAFDGIAIGRSAISNALSATAIGRSAIASGVNSVAIGTGAVAADDDAIAIGTGITTDQPGGFFVRHRDPGAVVTNPAGFLGNELVENGSSERFKDNIRSLEDISDRFDQLNPVRYNAKPEYGDPTAEHIGLIAEEVNELFPEFVVSNGGVITGLCYDRMVALCIKEIQKIKGEISQLQGN